MEDRRIRKTKKAFCNALIELLKKNAIRYISVQELCDLADSHRSTFYYHYSDIYALYEEMETKILDEFASAVSASPSHSYYGVYDNIIAHLQNNRNVWTVLLGSNGNRNFKDKVSSILEKKYLEIWKYETGRHTFSDEFHIIVRSNISAFLTLFTEWLKAGDDYPADKVKSVLSDMDAAFDSLPDKYL